MSDGSRRALPEIGRASMLAARDEWVASESYIVHLALRFGASATPHAFDGDVELLASCVGTDPRGLVVALDFIDRGLESHPDDRALRGASALLSAARRQVFGD